LFIRKRLSSRSKRGRPGFSHQVLESYRHDGKIKHRVICNLGPHATPEEALEACVAELEALQNPPECQSPTDELRGQADRMRRAEQTRRQIEELKAVVAAWRGSEKR